MAYELFEPFPDIRVVKNLFTKELAATPKYSFDFKRSVLKPQPLSFLNLVNFTGHFKVEHDPYGYKSALEKYNNDETTRLEKEEKNHQECLKEISKLEAELSSTFGDQKAFLETKIAQMKEHEAQDFHAKAGKKPERFNNKFLSIDYDFENKFDNDDSAKFKYGNSGVMEANFVMKNLYDKNTVLAGDASAFQRYLFDNLKNRELNITVGKELGKTALKNINLQLKSKNSSENINLTINNSVSYVEKMKNNEKVTKEKVNTNYKLVYNYPVNENFKIKATFADNFLSNNNVELKFRRNLWGKLNFLNLYSMKFGFNTETVKSKEQHEHHQTYHTEHSLINFFKPEKSVFAFTYDIDHVAQHKFKPYLGFVLHNVSNNKDTTMTCGYLHNMDFTRKASDGTVHGLKFNYSLLYKYDNFFQKLAEKGVFGGKSHSHHHHDHKPEAKKEVVGKQHLALGAEYTYLFDKNPYINSVTGKVLVTDSAVRFHKNYAFKKYGDLFNSVNLAVKFNIEKEKENYVYRTGFNVEFA